MVFVFNNLHGQVDTTFVSGNALYATQDTIIDTLAPVDSSAIDSLFSPATDSLPSSPPPKKRLSSSALQSSVKYISQDSIIINLLKRKIILFEDAKAYYEDIELNAAFMEFGFTNSELYASGVADSSGHIHGSPVFKQGDTDFGSQEIRYNFNTKKAKVTNVITCEGEGFIHGHYIKHVDDKTSYIKDGQYTTCNLPDPHFQIRFPKAKVIQNDKIITGPAYMSFGNIPTPLAIPFGFFPLHKDRSSGIIMPTYGEGANLGFYFENFGYYFGINDNFDLSLLGYLSTRGSWGAKTVANYVFRYKCAGEVELGFKQTFRGERQTPSWDPRSDFRVSWKHKQDPKSHPTTRFAAEVNVMSPGYNQYTPSAIADYLSNQFNSSISLSTSANGTFFFDAALYYRQNTHNRDVSLSLPAINMSIRQFYPFRKKHKAGKLKWYDNISMRWSSQMSNQINADDTLFFKAKTWEEIQSNIQHTIPLTIPIKVGKAFNWNTNATLTERWYLQRDQLIFSPDTTENGDLRPGTEAIFQRGFFALHDVNLSTSLTTKVFLDYATRKGGLQARHVMSPDLSFSYQPNLNGNNYGTYFNTITEQEVQYAYFGGGIPRTRAVARLTVNNNLQIKVKSKKDTITGMRKFTIFDNVGISCGYDFAADSLNWQPLTILGRTSLFSFLDITFRLSFDPYIINEEGRRVNQTEARVNGRGMRFSGSELNFNLNWRINQDFFKRKKKEEKSADAAPKQQESVFPTNSLGMPNVRPDFRTPWSVTITYMFIYTTFDNLLYYTANRTFKKYDSNIVQNINIVADVSITRKWKIGITTNYDIQQRNISYTSIDVYRDLHCWEMKFRWVPFGWRKSWEFTINVKASVLQDLKYKTEKNFMDNY